MKESKIYQIYLDLLQKYGSPEKYWPQWCKKLKTLRDREIIALGAILTQRTSWHNAETAILNLKKTGLLSLKKISELQSSERLIPYVRVAGFYQSKPRRLFDLCTFVVKNYGNIENLLKDELKIIKEKLLSLYGIGPETADTILLYSLDKPSFVIDEYTKRLAKKEELAYVLILIFLVQFLPPLALRQNNQEILLLISIRHQRIESFHDHRHRLLQQPEPLYP